MILGTYFLLCQPVIVRNNLTKLSFDDARYQIKNQLNQSKHLFNSWQWATNYILFLGLLRTQVQNQFLVKCVSSCSLSFWKWPTANHLKKKVLARCSDLWLVSRQSRVCWTCIMAPLRKWPTANFVFLKFDMNNNTREWELQNYTDLQIEKHSVFRIHNLLTQECSLTRLNFKLNYKNRNMLVWSSKNSQIMILCTLVHG